jgi:hypothetical protein
MVFLEAVVAILAVSIVLASAGGRLPVHAAGLLRWTGDLAWGLQWLAFETRARRAAEAVELSYWDRNSDDALRPVEGGLEVHSATEEGRRRLTVVRRGRAPVRRVEVRIEGEAATVLRGITRFEVFPWRGTDGAVLGIELRVEGPVGSERHARLRFGTPGGTL